MGLLLILVGIILWATHTATFIGIILVAIGLILFFVPTVPYGYSSWSGRRPPP